MEFTEVFEELREYARIIRNEKTTSANTALRIGDMYLSIIDAMEQIYKRNDLFSLRTDDNGSQYIHTPYALASDSTLSSLGVGSDEDGGSGLSYDRLDSWDNYVEGSGAVLGADLGYGLLGRIEDLEQGTSGDISEVFAKVEENANAIAALQDEHNALAGTVNDFLTGVDVDDTINRWKELENFLAGYTETATLADLLGVKADKSVVDALTTTVNSNYTTLDGLITAEKNRAVAAEGALSGRITTNATNIETNRGNIAKNAKDIADIFATLADWFMLEDGVLHSKYGLASDSTVSSLGVGTDGTGGVSYDRLDSWDSYTDDKAGYVLSAALGWDLKTRLDNLDMGDFDLSSYLTKSEASDTYATIAALNSGLADKQNTISDLVTIREGAALGATALQEHQAIYGLTIKGSDGTSIPSYTPNSKAAELTLAKSHVGLGNVDNLAAEDYFTKLDSHAITGAIIVEIGGTKKTITASSLKDSLSLNNVENTKLSTWKGTANITTLGTVTSGTWNAAKIVNDYIANPHVTIAGNKVVLGGSLSVATLQQSLDIVTLSTEQTITGKKTFTKQAVFSNGIQIGGDGATLWWDGEALRVNKPFASDSTLSSLGVGSDEDGGISGGGVIDLTHVVTNIVPSMYGLNIGSASSQWSKLYVTRIENSQDDLYLDSGGFIRMLKDVVFGNNDNYSISPTGTAYLGNIYSNGNIVATKVFVTSQGYMDSDDVEFFINAYVADNIQGKYLLMSGGTLYDTKSDTPLNIKAGGTAAYIGFQLYDGTKLGSIGVNDEKTLLFYSSDETYKILHKGNTSYSPVLTSGTKIGTITIGDTATDLYAPTGSTVDLTNYYTKSEVHSYVAQEINTFNEENLATVATSGDYNDLKNKPTIPSLTGYAEETWVNSNFATADAFTALNNSFTGLNYYLTANGTVGQVLTKKSGGYEWKNFSVDWSNVSSKPTTLAGYGITDWQVLAKDGESIDSYKTTAGIYRWGSKTTSNTPDDGGYGNSITLYYPTRDTWGQLYIPYDNTAYAKDGIWWRGGTTSATGAWRKILDDSNFSDYALPLSGKGYLSFDANTRPVLANNQGYASKNASGGIEEILWMDNVNTVNIGGTASRKVNIYGTLAIDGKTALHSENVGEYVLFKRHAQVLTSKDNLNDFKSGYYGWLNADVPINGIGLNTAMLAMQGAREHVDSFQLVFDYNKESMHFRCRIDETNWKPWKTIAFTDSNVASAKEVRTADDKALVQYNGVNTLYIGDGIYDTSQVDILGSKVVLRYGASATTGLILNSSGNVTIGSSDLATTNYKLYVNGGSCVNGSITCKSTYIAEDIARFSRSGYAGISFQGISETEMRIMATDKNGSWSANNFRVFSDGSVYLGGRNATTLYVKEDSIEANKGINIYGTLTGYVSGTDSDTWSITGQGAASFASVKFGGGPSIYKNNNETSLVIATKGVSTANYDRGTTLQVISKGAVGVEWSTAIYTFAGSEYNVVGSGVGLSLGGYAKGNSSAPVGRGAGIAAVAEAAWYNATGLAFYINHGTSDSADHFTEKMRLSCNGHLIPMHTTSQTLGTSDKRWNNVYSSYPNVSGAASVGSLTINGATAATQDWVTNKGYATTTSVNNSLGSLSAEISAVDARIDALGTAASKNWSGASTTDTTNLVTIGWVESKLGGYAKAASIPTKTSQLTNDSKFVSGSIETTIKGGGTGLVTGGAVYSFVEGSLSGYAKKATTLAGYGITDALPNSNPSVAGTLTVAGNVLPSNNNDTHALGSANYRWSKLYTNGVDCTGAISSTTNISAQGNVTAINGGLSGKTLSVSGAASVGSLTVNGVAITGNGSFNGGTVSGKTIFGSTGSHYLSDYQVYVNGSACYEGLIDAYGGLAGDNWEIMDTGDAYFQSVDQASDYNLKSILKDVRLSLGTMANAPLVQFDWKNRTNKKHHVGTIAQYWGGCLPEVVSRTKGGTLALAYGELGVAMGISLANILEDTNGRVATVEEEIKVLKEENKRLKERVAELEAA